MKLGFDIIFFAVIGLSTVGSFFLGEEKSQRLMIGVITGSFAASIFAEPIYKLVGSKVSFINQGLIALTLLALCIVMCVLAKNVRDSKWPKSKIKALIAGALSGLAGMAYVIAALPEQTRSVLITEHNLAAIVYDLRIYLMAALVLALLLSYWTIGKAKK